MATSEVGICNKALARLGIKNYIESLTDQSEEAETCSVFYENARDTCLASYEWPFATNRKILTQASDEEKRDGWSYVLTAPTDLMVARYMLPVNSVTTPPYDDLYGPNINTFMNPYLRVPRPDQRIPYAFEKATSGDGSVILCDLPNPVLFYTCKITDTTKFPALFEDALGWLLAAEMALPLTQSEKKEVLARQRYMERIHMAYAVALNEQQEDPEPDTESIASRR